MEESVFTKIIKGDISCHKVYEDSKTLAFLDIHPLMPGHTLVVPKVQVDHLEDLNDEDYVALMQSVKQVAQRVKTELGTKRSIVLVMGYDVPHAHVHIIPSNSGDDFYEVIGKVKELSQVEPNHNDLALLAERLRF